jgi:hypothetical protein
METKIHKMITERNAGAGKPRHLPNPLRPVLASVRLSDMENKMETKRCPKCKDIKSIELFRKNKSTKDGLQSYCKVCQDSASNRWISKNRDRFLEYHKNYQKTHRNEQRLNSQTYRERNPDYNKIYYQNNRDRYCLYWLIYRERFPEKGKAHRLIHNAIMSGDIFRQPCEVCGKSKAEAHHDDYSKPLDVRWLCKKHHARLHSNIKKALGAKEVKDE